MLSCRRFHALMTKERERDSVMTEQQFYFLRESFYFLYSLCHPSDKMLGSQRVGSHGQLLLEEVLMLLQFPTGSEE